MISGIFGLPGSGKSLLLGFIAQRAVNGKNINYHSLVLGSIRKYKYVYTNFSCQGCYKLDYEKLGILNYSDCLILVDEIMLLSDSRDYKKFTDNLKFFYSEHRKSNCDFIYASQSYDDVDKKIRNRTQQLYYVDNWFLEFSRVRRIVNYFDVSNGKINEGYIYAPAITDFHFWRPKYYKNIDSYELINGQLQEQQPELIPWESNKKVIK
ncbi:MAG: ATP-binding protein [Ruminococcus sp.]|nr:ATP-binding protein [Ruminococcus sp.]